MPRATYCNPQVASYGLTEKQAIQEGYRIKVGKFPLIASGKAMAIGEVEGLTKIVTNEDSEEILGAHMIGSEVTEMLGELSLAMLLEGTSREVGRMVHAHPTLSETIKEAALSVDNEAIHI
jgi:dihydrolipoamide dehydrogenase